MAPSYYDYPIHLRHLTIHNSFYGTTNIQLLFLIPLIFFDKNPIN